MALLQIMTADQSYQRDQAQVQERYDTAMGVQVDEGAQFMCNLDAYLEKCWQAAKSAKEAKVEQEMLKMLRRREGVYDPDKLAAIRAQGGSEIFMTLTGAKCRAAKAWIRDVLLPAGERPFKAKPTPIPDLSIDIKQTIIANTLNEVQQAVDSGIYPTQQQVYQRARQMYDESMQRLRDEAKARAQRMEDAIDDVLVEGAWYDAMEDMISDLTVMHTAFIKGPVIRKKRRLRWEMDPVSGKAIPMAEDELVPMFYSPSGLDIYPASDSTGPMDGYYFEVMKLRRQAIYNMIGVPTYNEKRIRLALDEYQLKGSTTMAAGEQERRELERSRNWQMTPDANIEAREFTGCIRGEWLIEWGMPESQIPDKDAEYEVTALKIGRHTVRVALNEDPLYRRNLVGCSYDKIKGQFWGNSLAWVIRDNQDMCNAAARNVINNMGMASGPLTEVEADRLAAGETVSIYPWRIIQTQSTKTGSPSPAVRFTVIPVIVAPLMNVYTFFSSEADKASGVPSYEQGVNPTMGAAGTASGMSMLINMVSRQIKDVIAGIDRCTEWTVNQVHTLLMLHDPRPEIKGDTQLQAQGTSALIVKEQQMLRRQQLLQITANGVDAPILGKVGRAGLLRETMQSMDIDADEYLPTQDQLLAEQQAERQAQQAIAQAQQQAQLQGGAPMPGAPMRALPAPA